MVLIETFGKIIYTEASLEASNSIMKNTNKLLKYQSFKKRGSKTLSSILESISLITHVTDGVRYNIEFGKDNGIGYKSEWPMFLVAENEKCLIGHLFVKIPFFGRDCIVSFLNTNREKV